MVEARTGTYIDEPPMRIQRAFLAEMNLLGAIPIHPERLLAVFPDKDAQNVTRTYFLSIPGHHTVFPRDRSLSIDKEAGAKRVAMREYGEPISFGDEAFREVVMSESSIYYRVCGKGNEQSLVFSSEGEFEHAFVWQREGSSGDIWYFRNLNREIHVDKLNEVEDEESSSGRVLSVETNPSQIKASILEDYLPQMELLFPWKLNVDALSRLVAGETIEDPMMVSPDYDASWRRSNLQEVTGVKFKQHRGSYQRNPTRGHIIQID